MNHESVIRTLTMKLANSELNNAQLIAQVEDLQKENEDLQKQLARSEAAREAAPKKAAAKKAMSSS